jgi:hypothetical protein
MIRVDGLLEVCRDCGATEGLGQLRIDGPFFCEPCAEWNESQERQADEMSRGERRDEDDWLRCDNLRDE